MRSVTLGKVRYKVRVVKDAQRHRTKYAKIATSDALYGYLVDSTKTIVVESGQPEQMASTALHEMLHVLLPYLDEAYVREVEDKLFPVLWRGGWRPF